MLIPDTKLSKLQGPVYGPETAVSEKVPPLEERPECLARQPVMAVFLLELALWIN